MEPTKKRVHFVIAGILYGIAVCIWSFFSLGMGHGDAVLFVIFSSPFSSFFNFYLALSLIPVIWTIFGLLMAFLDYPVSRFIFLVIITSHYITIFYFLISPPYANFWGDFFRYLNSINGASTIVIGLAAYLVGQVVMWRRFIKSYSEDVE